MLGLIIKRDFYQNNLYETMMGYYFKWIWNTFLRFIQLNTLDNVIVVTQCLWTIQLWILRPPLQKFINWFYRSLSYEGVGPTWALAGLELNHAEAFAVSLILLLRQRVSGVDWPETFKIYHIDYLMTHTKKGTAGSINVKRKTRQKSNNSLTSSHPPFLCLFILVF